MAEKLELTPQEWQRAQNLAQSLAKDVDRNEFGKIVTYMQRTRDPERTLKLLQRLPDSKFIRSNQTRGYLQRIRQAYEMQLHDLPPDRALLVASWAFRLMTYYQSR